VSKRAYILLENKRPWIKSVALYVSGPGYDVPTGLYPMYVSPSQRACILYYTKQLKIVKIIKFVDRVWLLKTLYLAKDELQPCTIEYWNVSNSTCLESGALFFKLQS